MLVLFTCYKETLGTGIYPFQVPKSTCESVSVGDQKPDNWDTGCSNYYSDAPLWYSNGNTV